MSEQDYFISFVEEFGSNPDYFDWIFGRIEVYYPHPLSNPYGYADEEIHWMVQPENRDRFYEFRDRWDFIDITEYHLNWLRDWVKKKYQEDLDESIL